MVPPAISNNGAQPPAAASAIPLLRLGRGLTRASDQADRGLPNETPRSTADPADQHGRHPRGAADVPLTKGTPREQCRRRPQGHNGCEEDDRSSNPRFRSAPTDDKHRSDARFSYKIRHRLSPSPAAAPCPILPAGIARSPTLPPPRPLRALHENGACPQRFHRDPHRNRAPQSPRFPKRGPSVERGHCGERDGARNRPPGPPGRLQAARRPPVHPRRRPPRCAAPWPRSCPAGPKMAGSTLPAIFNLLDADGAEPGSLSPTDGEPSRPHTAVDRVRLHRRYWNRSGPPAPTGKRSRALPGRVPLGRKTRRHGARVHTVKPVTALVRGSGQMAKNIVKSMH